jgi:prepilin peptidase CpaA
MDTFRTLTFVSLLGLAALWDVRARRMPNWLTLGGVATGLAWSLSEGGVAASLLGVGIALAVSLPFWALGAIGAGDVKMLSAVGAFLGPAALADALLLSALAGGVMAVYTAARRSRLRETLREMAGIVVRLASLGMRGRGRTIASPGAITVPYGVAIAIGAGLAWFGG